MAFIHGKGAAVLHGVYDLSAFLNNASASGSVETGETTCFGAQSKTYVVGLKDGGISVSGLYDAVASGSDVVLYTALGTNDVPTTVIPQGSGTLGNRAQMIAADATSYEVSTPVADVVSVSAEFQASGGFDGGVLLATLSSRTATENTTSVDNGAATTNGGVAHIHVTANTRAASGTIVKVQHSSDNTTFADLATFTTIGTTTTSERVTVAAGTTVNRYVRHAITAIGGASGAITHAVVFARR